MVAEVVVFLLSRCSSYMVGGSQRRGFLWEKHGSAFPCRCRGRTSGGGMKRRQRYCPATASRVLSSHDTSSCYPAEQLVARQPSQLVNAMAPHDFNGRVALVTGGGSGIGRAVCQLLARDGARVLVTDLNLKGAQETVKLMPGSGLHLALQMDVTRRDAVEAAIAAAREEFGVPPSLLVNSAGVAGSSPFEDVKEDQLSAFIDVNLKGTFLVSQAVTKTLLERRQQPEEETGAVVNIASMMGKCGMRDWSHYAATKGAVIALTKTCAAELAGKGVRVNCVLPGFTDTPMTQELPKEEEQMHLSSIPLARKGRPEEVAEVVVFLLSRRSSYMVGASVEVSGGTGM